MVLGVQSPPSGIPAGGPRRSATDMAADKVEASSALLSYGGGLKRDFYTRPREHPNSTQIGFGARIGSKDRAASSTGTNCACLATASIIRCVSRPKLTSCQPITLKLISPAALIAAAVKGQPRISAEAVRAP